MSIKKDIIVNPFSVKRGDITESEIALVKQWHCVMRNTVDAMRSALLKFTTNKVPDLGAWDVPFSWGGRGMGGCGWDTRAPWGEETICYLRGHRDDLHFCDNGPSNGLYRNENTGIQKELDAIGNKVRNRVRRTSIDQIYEKINGWSSHDVKYSFAAAVRAYSGSLLDDNEYWPYIDHAPGVYPWQCLVDLWEAGLFPVFDNEIWRLHSGKRKTVAWEGIPDSSWNKFLTHDPLGYGKDAAKIASNDKARRAREEREMRESYNRPVLTPFGHFVPAGSLHTPWDGISQSSINAYRNGTGPWYGGREDRNKVDSGE